MTQPIDPVAQREFVDNDDGYKLVRERHNKMHEAARSARADILHELRKINMLLMAFDLCVEKAWEHEDVEEDSELDKQLKRLTTPCEPGIDPSSDWSIIQCQRPYTFENTGAAYVANAPDAGERVPIVVDRLEAPTRSILPLTDEQIEEAAAAYSRLDQAVTIQIGQIEASLPETTKRWLEGYVRGLNHVIANKPELPQEFQVLGLKREMWSVSDVLTVGRLIGIDVNWLDWKRSFSYCTISVTSRADPKGGEVHLMCDFVITSAFVLMEPKMQMTSLPLS